MKTHRVLYEKFGENAGSAPDPIRAFVVGQDEPLLLVKSSACLSSDDDRPVSINRYEAHDVCLPDWLELEQWIGASVAWSYAWGMGVRGDWPEAWQRGLRAMPEGERYAACKLLATETFRSEFRRSMRDRIVAWLETPAGERQYKSPLSWRQWDAILGPYGLRDARRVSENLYRVHRYQRNAGCPVPKARRPRAVAAE